MFSMPTSKYHLIDGKVNATLQALYDVIAADINKMSNEGLSTKYGVLCNHGTVFPLSLKKLSACFSHFP